MDKDELGENIIKLQSDVNHMKETLDSHIADDKVVHTEFRTEIKSVSNKMTMIIGGLIVISTLIQIFMK